MDDKLLNSICRQVYQRFPQVKGIAPKVRSQPNDTCVLIFQGKAVTASGASLPTTVRVSVSAAGKITKMSTSR